MTQWFGKSWGAPCCEAELHVETPVGFTCGRCLELILDGDQGFVMPHVRLDGKPAVMAKHLDCFLQSILPHGKDCPHCRGVDIDKHAPDCTMKTTGLCSCQPMPSNTSQEEPA